MAGLTPNETVVISAADMGSLYRAAKAMGISGHLNREQIFWGYRLSCLLDRINPSGNLYQTNFGRGLHGYACVGRALRRYVAIPLADLLLNLLDMLNLIARFACSTSP